MRDLKKREQTAIEAVASRFSATWEKGSDPPDAYILTAGKRVAVDIAILKRRGTGQGDAAKPRLRFDKVVIRLMESLQATLGEIVPDGMTVLLTVTAPIRLPSKTAASLEDKIQTLLRRKSPGRDVKDIIHGNRVQIRLLKYRSVRAPKLIGFVHNSDSDPLLLLNMTSELVDLASAEPRRGTPRRRRSMARYDNHRGKFMLRGLSLHLFAATHADRLQKDSHGVRRWPRRSLDRMKPAPVKLFSSKLFL